MLLNRFESRNGKDEVSKKVSFKIVDSLMSTYVFYLGVTICRHADRVAFLHLRCHWYAGM